MRRRWRGGREGGKTEAGPVLLLFPHNVMERWKWKEEEEGRRKDEIESARARERERKRERVGEGERKTYACGVCIRKLGLGDQR